MTDSQSQVSPISSVTVPLHSCLFQESIRRYLEESKPDALVKQQIESWAVEWTEQVNKSASIQGSLAIHGNYMVLTIHACCNWYYAEGIGHLEVSLRATARFRTRSELLSSDKEKVRKAGKIRSAVVARLQQDGYIKLLLGQKSLTLCEATIIVHDVQHQLEEKVFVNDDGLEAVRRCIFSHGEDTLSVMELLTSLDFFKTPDCPLGHRAKLRLLEESMLDACEKEGEEEMLDELAINDATSDEEQTSKRTKRRGIA